MFRRSLKAVLAVKAPAAFLVLCLLAGAACNFSIPAVIAADRPGTPTPLVLPATAPALPTDDPPIPTLVPSPTLLPSSTPPPFVEPAGCQRPPDDYTRMIVNGAKLNARTFWMLRQAEALDNKKLNFTGWGITQGSYNPGGVAASFGTHDAGGAVDLSVLNPRTGEVMLKEIPAAIQALRITGFAAWLRERNELYQGSPVHIHAIAIGDAELSPAAHDQLTGTFGYFRGYNGLPQTDNIPIPDRHGGPVFCQWMIDMGYRDLRQP